MVKAMLILDPQRKPEQTAYVAARAQILYATSDNLWVSMAEDTAARFAEQGIIVQTQPEAGEIRLPAVTFDPAEGNPEPPAAWRANESAEPAYYVVQFVGPILQVWLLEISLESHVQNVPVHAAIFRLTAEQANAVRALSYVTWVGLYHPAYKISPGLMGRSQPLDTATLRNLTIDANSLPASGAAGNVIVSTFDDMLPDDGRAAVTGTGATIVQDTMSGFRVNATAEQVGALARIPGVFAVIEHLPDEVGNDRARVIIGTTQVQRGSRDYLVNLDGSGEIAAVLDTGLDNGPFVPFPLVGAPPPALAAIHQDIRNRVLFIDSENPATPGTGSPDANGHGTHVTGSIAGDGAASGGRVRGMAPRAFIVFHGGGAFNYSFAFPQAYRVGARVHNNSWGTVDAVTNNAYLAAPSGDIDRFCYLHPEMLIVFISHNHEKDTLNNATGAAGSDGILDMQRLTRQAVAKNVLTIGATENWRNNGGWQGTYRMFNPGRFDHPNFNALAGGDAELYTTSDNPDHLYMRSNRGIVQASGGRIKPDLVAPGTNILSMRSSLEPLPAERTHSDPDMVDRRLYTFKTGTSMAAPIASGAAVLVRQFYRARFGQMRRPTLLQGVPLPRAGAPENTPRVQFVDRPTLCALDAALVFVWVTPALADAQKRLTGAVLSNTADLIRIGLPLSTLQTDVGNRPAPALARSGSDTLLLYRGKDGRLRLNRYAHDIAARAVFTTVNTFGTNGEVTINAPTAASDDFPPALLTVDEQATVVWVQASNNAVMFQRFNGLTGAAIDANPINLGTAAQTAPHAYVAQSEQNNVRRFAVVWVNRDGGRNRLQLRIVNANGSTSAQPTNVVDQVAQIKDASITWDGSRFVLVWCDARTAGQAEIRVRFLNPDGTLAGNEVVAVSVNAPSTLRRPVIARHPGGGYVLGWEDNTRDNSFDVYLTFLDANGQVDNTRMRPDPLSDNRRVLLVSDTPAPTSGLGVLADAQGIIALWQSEDEVNSHECGVYALRLTLQGAFQAQADPNTPLINSGQYVGHTLHDHTGVTLGDVDMVSTGGNYYLLREVPGATTRSRVLHLVKTNADGLPDAAYGVNAARTIIASIAPAALYTLHWSTTTNQVLCFELSTLTPPRISIFDANGLPVTAFGTGGFQRITEPEALNTAQIFPQVSMIAPGTVIVAYGTGAAANPKIRFALVTTAAPPVITGPRDLANVGGTAKHGWFHYLNAVSRAAAVYQRRVAPDTAIFSRVFDPTVFPIVAPENRVTTLAGESINAVIAPRATYSAAAQGPGAAREYGVAWQYRPNNATPWEIRFSRLDTAGAPRANAPAPAPAAATSDVRVIFPGMVLDAATNWPADASAFEPQLVSTATHEPWDNYTAAPWGEAAFPAPPHTFPDWSPGYGLAFIRQRPGGNRVLCFVALDENGRRVRVVQPPNVAAVPVTTLTTETANVLDFKLIWNGRAFRLTWTEVEAGRLRHKQAGLTRLGSRAIHDQPSAPLLRATLINGAVNINNTQLPNVNDGYGWGRINLRQSLTPSNPVTFQARDDSAVAQGQTARYRFDLAPGTQLLRATLTWNDVPGAALVNQLRLRITAPDGQVYYGNTWLAGRARSRPVPPAAVAGLPGPVHNTEQIALDNPPIGSYTVEVIGVAIPANAINPLQIQPFALVFVGSGAEVPLTLLPAPGDHPFY